MNCIEIKSVSDFISKTKELISTDAGAAESYLRYEYLFRGQSNERYELIPTLGRLGDGHTDVYFPERNMIFAAKTKLPTIFSNDLLPIELLGLLQHYGIPTRLLDLTENALVALYFACASSFEKNGEVFIFKNDITDVSYYPIEFAIAESYKYVKASFWSLEDFYQEVSGQDYFDEQRLTIDISDSKAGALWVEKCCKDTIFTHSPLKLTRQQNQSGRYILFPNKINHVSDTEPGSFSSRIQAMDKNDKSIVGRLTILAKYKKELLKEMNLLGITREFLFADSPDIVCEEIKKKYFVSDFNTQCSRGDQIFSDLNLN